MPPQNLDASWRANPWLTWEPLAGYTSTLHTEQKLKRDKIQAQLKEMPYCFKFVRYEIEPPSFITKLRIGQLLYARMKPAYSRNRGYTGTFYKADGEPYGFKNIYLEVVLDKS